MYSGSKTFHILRPEHPSLKEGHIREAKFNHNFIQSEDGRKDVLFRRDELLDSTSRVHSPSLCLEREGSDDKLHALREKEMMTCKIDEGDMLFLPAYYWHVCISDAICTLLCL